MVLWTLYSPEVSQFEKFPNYNYALVIQGSSQNYNKEVCTSYYFRTVAQIKRKCTVPQAPMTQYVIQSISELGELPHVEKSNFMSPKFCTSGQCPRLQDKVTRGAMSRNLGQCPRLRDKVTRGTMSCNLGQCPRLQDEVW
jgi:hypothetical protein